MLDQMKKAISEDIKTAYTSGKVTIEEIEQIVEKSVAIVIENAKDDALDVNKIAKEAVSTTMKELQLLEKVTKEMTGAILNGTIKGITKNTQDAINETDIELLKTKYRLQEQKDRLTKNLKNAFDGANEASSKFSGETKLEIEDAVINIKLKSVESLGIMQDTIKHSVKVVIEEGEDVQNRVANITKEATENALNSGQLTAEKTKEISELVMLSAIESAQELDKYIEETTKGAVYGTRDGVTSSIESVKIDLIETKDDAIDSINKNIDQTIKDINTIENAFIDALGITTNKVGDIAQSVLKYSISELRELTSTLHEMALNTSEIAITYLKKSTQDVTTETKGKVNDLADDVKDEIVDLAEKMAKISKGAILGLVDGAKKAIEDKK
ncbi:MAG: hypothetical protein JJV88_04030 [Sulfurovum sp.]|nr:hypothetical protein [Sulfurovaceae bacterium]